VGNSLPLLLASPALLWALLFALTLARRGLAVLRTWAAERRRVPLAARPARDAAERAAADRRAQLHDFLRGELDLDPEEDLHAGHGSVRGEFLEPLPDLRGLPAAAARAAAHPFAPDDPARYWHTSFLYWQLDADQNLLAGRVLDVLARLRRGRHLTDHEAPTHVRLAPLPGGTEAGDRFPWRIVVGAPVLSPRLRDAFAALTDWLGIGVEFERAKPVRLGGAAGVIGGVISTPDGSAYGLACRHAVGPANPDLVFPEAGPPGEPADLTTAGPNAALVLLPAGGGALDLRGVIPATRKALTSHRDRRTPLSKSRRGDRRLGEFSAGEDVAFVSADGATYCGPHLLVSRRPRRVLGVDWPPWGGGFESPADSGCWVLAGGAEWVGVLVAGRGGEAYVLPAYYLLDVFRRALGVERLGAARRVV
jgi:hypothetical protein